MSSRHVSQPAIGKAATGGLLVETFGTEAVDPVTIQQAITDVSDLRPAAIIRERDLPADVGGHGGIRPFRPGRRPARTDLTAMMIFFVLAGMPFW